MRNYRIILFLVLSLISMCSWSGPFAYECEILHEKTLENDGSLKKDNKTYQGNKFNIERSSGIVLGGGLGNSSYPTKTVIDPGGKEQSFKLLYLSQDIVGTNGGKNAVYLTVKEYSESYEKPFIVVAGSHVLTGVCD